MWWCVIICKFILYSCAVCTRVSIETNEQWGIPSRLNKVNPIKGREPEECPDVVDGTISTTMQTFVFTVAVKENCGQLYKAVLSNGFELRAWDKQRKGNFKLRKQKRVWKIHTNYNNIQRNFCTTNPVPLMEASKLIIFVSKSWNRVLIVRDRAYSPRIGEYFIVVFIRARNICQNK